MRYYPMSFDRAAVVDWILRNRTRYANDGYGLWAMILKSTGELIGDCGLVRQSVDGVGRDRNRLPRSPRSLGPGIRFGSRPGLPRLRIRESQGRPAHFPDPPRESGFVPRRREKWHDHLERSNEGEFATLRLRDQARPKLAWDTLGVLEPLSRRPLCPKPPPRLLTTASSA